MIYVVSGLPRSGTSLMMQLLQAGGLPVLSDGARSADEDNPRGYYELEAVKRSRQDSAWLAQAEGCVVKVISRLLTELPPDRKYKVVFMRRALEEVLLSQRAMLERRGEKAELDDAAMKEVFIRHLGEVEAWLATAAHAQVLYVNHGRLLADSRANLGRIKEFVALELDIEAMLGVIDPALWRARAARE